MRELESQFLGSMDFPVLSGTNLCLEMLASNFHTKGQRIARTNANFRDLSHRPENTGFVLSILEDKIMNTEIRIGDHSGLNDG